MIDPFFSQTAAKADQWIPIMPGTDGAMALAMANVIINRELYDKDFVARHVFGFEEFKQHVQKYTPDWAAKITGVPANVIIGFAVEYATRQPSALFPGDGPSRVGPRSLAVGACLRRAGRDHRQRGQARHERHGGIWFQQGDRYRESGRG